jgi:hypothetical protein
MALSVTSQRVFLLVVYFVIDSIRKHLDRPSYVYMQMYLVPRGSTIKVFTSHLRCKEQLSSTVFEIHCAAMRRAVICEKLALH